MRKRVDGHTFASPPPPPPRTHTHECKQEIGLYDSVGLYIQVKVNHAINSSLRMMATMTLGGDVGLGVAVGEEIRVR